MANLQATLRGQTALDIPVSEIVARSNRLLYHSTDPEKFATLFMGVLEPATHVFEFCNAGHEHPMLFRHAGGGLERLDVGGIALGVLDAFPYEQAATKMEPGDVLVVYSDGIPDAVNEFESPFGEDRVVQCIREHIALPAAGLMNSIIEAVHAHEQGAPRADDLTVIVVKRTR
jgi:sigma-B regulation protein RsbU (phosphoserine phosphatase)